MKCKVEGNEIVLRLPKENIAFCAENYYGSKIISDKFYDKFAELILDLHDCSEDALINRFLDRVFDGLTSYHPELVEISEGQNG